MKIVQKDNPVLRQKAKSVKIDEIGSQKIQNIIKNMSLAVHAQKDGIAIAAPQIGVSLRMFIVRGDLLQMADPNYRGEARDLIFINPEITKLSRDKAKVEEGCLSVRWLYGKVKRSKKASIRAYDENGKKIERGASGLLAQIFQHECDHLEGELFIDKADEVWEMSEEEIKDLTS